MQRFTEGGAACVVISVVVVAQPLQHRRQVNADPFEGLSSSTASVRGDIEGTAELMIRFEVAFELLICKLVVPNNALRLGHVQSRLFLVIVFTVHSETHHGRCETAGTDVGEQCNARTNITDVIVR